jgi:hypothetical protein
MRRVLAAPACLVLAMALSMVLIGSPGVMAAPGAGVATDVAGSPAAVPTALVAGNFSGVAEVVDSANKIHIAATGKGGVWYITNRSGTWTRHKILSQAADEDWHEPLIAIDEHNRIYIAATKDHGPDVTINEGTFYVTDKGRAPGTFPPVATRIAPNTRAGTSLKVANGHIYLTMEYRICCVSPNWPAAWMRTNASGHWVNTKLGNGWAPSMRLPTNGHPRVVFSGKTGIQYAVAATASGSYSTVRIPNTSANDINPILSLDVQGRSAAAWLHDSASGWAVRYSTRRSGSWSAPATVSSASEALEAFSFDIDSAGRAHVLVSNVGNHTLKDMRLSGGVWHATTIASGVDVHDVSVRRAAAGTVDIAWLTDSGIFVAVH